MRDSKNTVRVSISVPKGVMPLVRETCQRESRTTSNAFVVAMLRYAKKHAEADSDEHDADGRDGNEAHA